MSIFTVHFVNILRLITSDAILHDGHNVVKLTDTGKGIKHLNFVKILCSLVSSTYLYAEIYLFKLQVYSFFPLSIICKQLST